MIRDYPHYHRVPKDMDENLHWRREVLLAADADPGFAATLKRMCREDVLFYLNGFVWTFDPRISESVDGLTRKMPFVTYKEFQDEAIDELLDAIERGYDVAWPKSRAMGATWMGLCCLEWLWHFHDDMTFMLVSWKEEYVDNGSPKSLFWKIDFIHKMQPKWLLPTGRWLGNEDPARKKLHLDNVDTSSSFEGEATTGDVGRGARDTAMFIDEFAACKVNDGYRILTATRAICRCRLFNSTPQGNADAFYDVVHNSGAKIRRMHWSKHPDYRAGLYTSEKDSLGVYRLKRLDEFSGSVKVLRKEWGEPRYLNFPEDYPFILDGELRSPWYDSECARCVSMKEIAQELNIDFLGSSYQFFDAQFIDMLIAEYCTPPMMQGRLHYDPMTLEPEGFEVDSKGPLSLWFQIPGNGILPGKEYLRGRKFGIGSDVSMGTGASNSASCVMDQGTGRKVAAWRDSNSPPEKFADETVALAKWFNKAFMIWDATGAPGRSFTKRVMEHKYPRIYYRISEERARARITDQPGFFMNSEDRAVLLRDYRIVLQDRTFVNPSEPGMRECLQFVVQPGGKIEHAKSVGSQDPTGAHDAHGDEAIADALVSRLLSVKQTEIEKERKEPPYMSPAWRMREDALAVAAAGQEDW